MLRISQTESVVRFDLAHTLFGKGRYWTNAYFVDGLLIDSGCAYTALELFHAIQNQSPLLLVNTHSHEDHIGANAIFQKHFNIPIFTHPLGVPILKNPHQYQPLQLYRRVFWGEPQPSLAKPLQDGEWINGISSSYQVIYTPGHTPDHVCLYQPEKEWLFSGDLFNGGKDRAISKGVDIWGLIASLKKIANLPIRWLFPGCARVRQNPRGELIQKISYLEYIGDNILHLHTKGWDINTITNHVLGKPMLIEIITQGHFSRINLVKSYLDLITK